MIPRCLKSQYGGSTDGRTHCSNITQVETFAEPGKIGQNSKYLRVKALVSCHLEFLEKIYRHYKYGVFYLLEHCVYYFIFERKIGVYIWPLNGSSFELYFNFQCLRWWRQ